MFVTGIHLRKWLVLACFLFLPVNGQDSGPYFMVTFPATIESGSEAKMCVSLLKPNETLSMNIYLVHNNEKKTLLEKNVQEEFHHCYPLKAPVVEGESVQEIKVEVNGEHFGLTETRKVMFKSYDTLTFIQTDKPIYNPGQTVNFRIVTMDSNFVPCDRQYSTVMLQDNNQNIIGQWTNVSSERMILQLSHQLNPEAREGMYTVMANFNNKQTRHMFKVKKYVLPKFEVTVNTPERHSVGEEDLKLEVCARYTYGQPVPGSALVKMCRPFMHTYYDGSAKVSPCLVETVKLTETGCGSSVFNVTTFLHSENEETFQNSLEVTFTVTEEGTDISREKSQNIELTFQVGKVEFLDLPKTFERGDIIKGMIKLTTYSGTPIPGKKVYVFEGEKWSANHLFNLTTDINGLASFSVNASAEPSINTVLWASVLPAIEYYPPHKRRFFLNGEARIDLLQPATPYSPVYSELIIEDLEVPLRCNVEIPINIKYYIVGETTENYSTDLVYMVLSKGVIIHHGYEKVEVKDLRRVIEGKVSFKLSVDAEMAPVVQVVAYSVLPSENVIAAQRNFEVEKCFRNKVSLQFSSSSAVPGEENTLRISALPASLCGVSAVDQSVFIMEPGDRLNKDKLKTLLFFTFMLYFTIAFMVFNLLPVTSLSHYSYLVEDHLECLHVRPRRSPHTDHVYDTLKAAGLKMATNLAIRQPWCLLYKGVHYQRGYGGPYVVYNTVERHMPDTPMAMVSSVDGDFYAESIETPIETVRSFFPETWIWNLVETGDSGSAQIPVTVPDTITTWETEAFCLSSKGLGLASPALLKVFQPFFLELSLPYSIIRGEVFELKATIFNYLSKCIMVKVTPAPSSQYTLQASSDGQYSSCLCANGRKTFKWTLIPSVLGPLNVTVSAEAEQSAVTCDNEIVSVPERGRIDTVTRSLIVKAEGTEKTKTQSWLLCPQGNSISEELELTLPENVIEGSARATVTVLGDILGRALKNIDGLLRMPYGCGEQNIALLAPNIYILQYLEKTGQLTTAIREKATGFLKSGYQRQLNYRHYNGAYSTFGSGEGNTWLTAFVLRTFGQAKHYIFIDQQNIDSARKWLRGNQAPDGCFIRQGRLFNNRMKGGVNDNVTMTAYITASFLELGIKVETIADLEYLSINEFRYPLDPVISEGLSCLKSSVGMKNTYAAALLAYTFSLAGEKEIRDNLLEKLNEVALSGDGRLHWSQTVSEDSDSLAVEISSYVLLAVLSKEELTTADLGYASKIVSWLVRQQNPYGGFSSTQDTVVALQALALYSTKVYSSEGSSTVTVSGGEDRHVFDVNPNNKLLYQEKQLQNVPAKYSIEAKGSTCVSVGMALFYNIPTPAEISTLTITAKAEGNCTAFGQPLAINFTVTYTGTQGRTNMVIVDIKLLSGFSADPSELRYRPLVERVDSKEDHLIMYMKEVQKDIPMNYVLHTKQVLPVKNLKPAVIKVYDYYQTNDQFETEYSSPCA